MDDLENVPDRVNFVPCLKWVRRGKAKARPDRVQLDQSELAAIIEQTRWQPYRAFSAQKTAPISA